MPKFLEMRHFITYLLSLTALITLFSSCKEQTELLYAIDVTERVVCGSAEQEITIDYYLHDDILASGIQPTITSDSPWAIITENIEPESFKVKVTENSGSTRSATITIAAKNCLAKNITLMQYVTPPENTNHTLMYLFLGTSLSRYFSRNIDDAKIAIESGILGNSNRVLFFKQTDTSHGYISELCYDINGGECIEQRLEDIEIDNSGVITPEIIGSYIEKMARYAPSKRYGLVCAGHGQGWITREILTDNKDISALGLGHNIWTPAPGAEITRAIGEHNVQLDIAELAQGIELSGVALAYILFDACFMANIEAVYDLRNSANYVIASPCEIMGNGFPYHYTLPHLFADEGNTTDYVKAAESYYLFYRDNYSSPQRCGSITLFDCAEIEALAEATAEVIKSAKGEEEYNIKDLQSYEGQNPHHFYDFGQWVNVVATDEQALERFNQHLDNTIIATFTLDRFYSAYGSYGTYPIDLDVYSGVTTSAPSKAYPKGWKTTSWYKDVWGETEN